jgi:protein-tyrosine-phosphatase
MSFADLRLASIARRQMLVGVFLAILSVVTPMASSASPTPPHILFICQFGTAKSAIARELLKRRAGVRGVAVSVSSRGITPGPHLASSTRDTLLADGIVLDAEQARKLSATDLRTADIVVFFNPLPAPLRRKTQRDWSDVPSVNDSYPSARAELDRRVDRLLDEVARMRR